MSAPRSQAPARPTKTNLAGAWMSALLRWGIGIAVIVGVGHRIWLERQRLRSYEPQQLGGHWLLVSGVCYVAGLVTCAFFWRQAMADCGARPIWGSTLTAYFAGHLAKYVPGKGLTLIVRSTLVRGPAVTTPIAAITCLQETVLMMATGALLASLSLLVITLPHRQYWLISSGLLAAGLGILATPPFASWLGRLAKKAFPRLPEVPQVCRWPTLGCGAGIIALGWLLMATSLASVLAAMHQLATIIGSLGWVQTHLLLTVLVALATVVGFVSMTPGGLGTREWILIEALGPITGSDQAVVAAILLRLVWIVSEVSAAVTFRLLDSRWKRSTVHLN